MYMKMQSSRQMSHERRPVVYVVDVETVSLHVGHVSVIGDGLNTLGGDTVGCVTTRMVGWPLIAFDTGLDSDSDCGGTNPT